jgi:hypothetical protein
VRNIELPYDERHPILLTDHYISRLILREQYEKGHYGVAKVVALARKRFWIIKAHRIVKKIKSRCYMQKNKSKH